MPSLYNPRASDEEPVREASLTAQPSHGVAARLATCVRLVVALVA